MPTHILVINGDQSILELFQTILETEGYQVSLAKIAFQVWWPTLSGSPSLSVKALT